MFTNMRKSIIKMLSVILFVIIATTGFSADKYWVSGSGSWNDTNHWSETSGGNPGASIPTQFDNVIFDNNSFSQNGQQVIIKDIAVCNDFRWEVENVKAELKSKSYLFKSITKSEIQVYGSLFINENINNEFFGDIVLKGENENEIVIENKINSDIIISAKDGKYYLEEPLNTNGNISLIQGSFITQNHRIECESFIGSGIENRELILGESKIYTKSWNIEVSENIVLNSGESVIYFKEDFSKKTFKTGGLEYNKFSTADAKSAFTYTVTITDVTCNGAENGIIKADVTSGGTQPFTYSLYDSDLILLQSSGAINSTTFTFKPTAAPGVSGGSYLVRIRDAEGTINGGFYFVFEPEVLSAGSISVQTPLSCYDGSDAALEAFPTGGTEPYTYEWFIRSGAVYVPIGQTTKIATGLAQGIYRVFVDDANFCGPEYVQFAFTKPPRNDNEIPPLLVIDDISSTSTCFGLSNGTITITAHGGSAPLTYAIVRTSDSDSSTNAIGTFTGLQADTYKIYVIDDNGCTKQGANETIIEVPNPTASITPDPATTCPSVGLILNGNPLGGSGTYTTHAWSDVGSTSLNFTNIQSPTFTNATSGSYALTYTVTDNNGCIGSDNINVTVKVSSVAPTGATVDNNNFCPGAFANITLSYVGGTLGTGAVARWYSDATFTTLVGTGQNLVIAAPLVTTTYYVRFEGDCNNTTAASVTVTVKTQSTDPTSITTSNNNFCPGGSGTLTVTGGSLGTGASWRWYSGSCGGTFIGTGASISVSPATTTTYYVRAEGDCNTTACASIIITVKTQSTAPTGITVVGNNYCPGGSSTLTVTGGSLGTGASWRWYSGSCGGTSVGSGASISVSPVVTTTYYVRAEGDCNVTTCASTIITVKTASVAPTSATVDNNNFCPLAFANITLTYSGGSLGTGAVARWYSDATFTTLVGTGQNLVIAAPAVTTTYYVRFEGDCNNTTAASVTVTVKTQSTDPTSITTSNNNFCPGGSSTLTVTGGSLGTGASWRWYSGSCGGTAVGTGSSISVSPIITTTYYVRAEGDCNTTACANTTVTVKVSSVAPTGATVDNNNFCPGAFANITLSYVGGTLGTGAVARWYSDATFTTLVGTGQNLVIAAPLVTTTYYVRFEGDCNNTTAASVTVTVKTESIAPTSASVDHTNFCVGAYANIILSYTLGTLGTNATAEWYSDAAFTIPIGTGQNLSIPAPLVTTTYYVRFEGDCNNTAAASVTVTVYPNPTATITPDPAITCTFVDLNLDGNPAGGSGTYTTHSWTGADLSPLDDPSIQNPVFNSNTAGTYSFTYTVTDDNGCTGTDNIDVEVNNSATAYAGMDVTLCYDTPYQILDADSADCSGISWSSDGGDGSFDDVNLINPTYTPGVNDLLNGFVDLVLTAHGIAPCSAVTDTVRINYLPILRAAIGKPSPFKIDSVITGTPTHIEVYVKLSSHDYVANLGVYLVSPLDSVVELKPNCELLPTLWQSDATYRFYNDPLDTSATALGVIDECDAFSGTYEFSGDWKKLHGQDPSNGAWRIRVVDYENWGIPGLLEEATIKFSDENKNAVFESILYADSSINKPIKRYSAINGPGITEQTLTITGLTTSCFDLCDATAVVTANGGQPPYLTYEWSDDINFTNIIALTDTVETLCPGVYYARVTDSNGCTAIDSVTVGSPPEIHITNSTVVHNVCYGDSVGEVTLEFSGGTGTLTYTYNTYTGAPKNSGETFNELKAGSYLFTITDVSGCTKDTLITITEGIQISVSYNITPVTCNGGSDGEIQIIASGGLAPYNYSITKIPEWSNTTGVFTGLTGDSVYIAVRDANLCIVFSDTVEITEPSPISIDLIEAFPVSCIGGGFDGEIVVTASGGKGTLRYSLDNITFQPSNTFIGLITGTYSIYVADDCDTVSAIDAAIITGPIPIVIDVVVITDVNTCYGDNTGTITVTASGGTGNYEYSVDNGVNYQPGNLFTGLYAGPYFISVRDDDGCTSADSTVNINQPDELLITSYIVTHSSECNIPANVGEIEIVTVTGGTPGYQYAVTGYPLQASSVFSGLSEGNYTITVQDANGCEVTIDTSVVLKPAMSVVLEKVDISCNGLTDGSISVDISNGTPAYTYLWSNGETTPSISNLPAGTYSVTVTDSNFPNSCVANESVEIIQPDAMQIAINLKDKFCINSDPKNPVLANGAINVDPTGGTPAYTYSWTGPGGYSSTSDYITNLEPGTYSLTITDSRGCIQTVDTIIAEDESFDIVITVSSDTNTICSYADGVNFEVNFTAADTLIWQYTPTQGVVPPNDTIEVSVSPYSFTDYPLISTEYLVKALNEYCEDYYPGSSADPKVFITVNQGLGLYITDNNDVEIDTVKIKFEGTEELYGRVLNTTVSATYNWNPTIGVENPISQITKITPSESMWYYLIGESSDGCVEADSVYFNFIPDVTPSDGFSPNGDGINDFWYIQEIDNFPNNVVQVFNRWGTKVFYQKGYSNLDENKRWDGTIENGKELPTGTYYYIINLNESQGTPQTGPVTIVR
ncbi:MAG: hypothetical protein A2X10_05365 [Bacteroidetes bacterium GWA2_33_15]|nr:MAG: hypothetical protein A2X10_05365 [Bacteroidetes bacterium GWA2_33_15]HAN19053.1 hypothetical protein [Bacteroidales bacterium]